MSKLKPHRRIRIPILFEVFHNITGNYINAVHINVGVIGAVLQVEQGGLVTMHNYPIINTFIR